MVTDTSTDSLTLQRMEAALLMQVQTDITRSLTSSIIWGRRRTTSLRYLCCQALHTTNMQIKEFRVRATVH